MVTASYEEIRHRLLDTLYAYFLSFHGNIASRPPGEEVGYLDHQFENVYVEPHAKLMKFVVLLVISGGDFPEQEERLRSNMTKLMEEHGLSNLWGGLTTQDAEDLISDMRLLGFAA
jgi:hypothetical protein